MKKQSIKKIIRITALFFILVFIGVSLWTANTINVRKNQEPPLVYIDKLPESKSEESPYFKYQICSKMPVKISSEAVEEPYPTMPHFCVVKYKGQRLVITDMSATVKMSVELFKTTHLRFTYGEMKTRELMGVMYELPTPEKRMFYYRPKHFEDALIYMLRSLDRALTKSTSYKKYGHPKFNIYVWDRPENQYPANQRVEIFSNELSLSCIGEICLDYFQAIEIL